MRVCLWGEGAEREGGQVQTQLEVLDVSNNRIKDLAGMRGGGEGRQQEWMDGLYRLLADP